MTNEEANRKAGLNQHLIGNTYKTEDGDIVTVDSVMVWIVSENEYETHAFFVDTDEEDFYVHENIDNIKPPKYILLT